MRVMKRTLMVAGLATFPGAGAPARAEERTAILEVGNLFRASCTYIARHMLADVPGVRSVEVSYQDEIARVVFDDSKTDAATLTEATARIGVPSRLLPQ